MPSRHAILRLACALGGLAIAGCYSPYRAAPYSPYGAGIPTYPQPVPVQPQFGPPAGSPTIVNPNGGFPPANDYGGSQFNNGTGLSPTPDPGANTFPPSNNGGFAPSNGFNPTLPPSNGTGLVPNYGDPENLPPTTGGSGTFEGGDRPAFGPDGASFQQDTSSESVSSTRFERHPAELQLASHQPTSSQHSPVVSAAAEFAPPVESTTLAAKKPNPYEYDAIGYRWLRGIVDFDEQLQKWVLIYNPTPGPRDVYKGQITLIDNGQLHQLKNNDVVLVEGEVEPLSVDPGTGKPQYRVTKLYGPLVPKS